MFVKDSLRSLGEGLVSPEAAELLSSVTLSQCSLLECYLEKLSSWTKRVDLVAPAPAAVLHERHVLDSAAAWALVKAEGLIRESSRVLDVGSGAGIPGLLFAVLDRTIDVTLCEPRGKRVVFLQEMRRELKLENIRVLEARVENIETNPEGAFDLITSRALGLETLLDSEAWRLLAPGGWLALMVGPTWEKHGKIKALTRSKSLRYRLPASGAKHRIEVFSKTTV